MVIYEVNLHVDREIADEYFVWLRSHVKEILELQLFDSAFIYEVISDRREQKYWTVHYHAPTQEALDTYLSEHASRMQNKGVERFGGNFSADRRTYRMIEEYR